MLRPGTIVAMAADRARGATRKGPRSRRPQNQHQHADQRIDEVGDAVSSESRNESDTRPVEIAGQERRLGDALPLARQSGGGLSPVIRALRLTTDEVQFGRVLASICQEPAVARAFTSAVVRNAVGGDPSLRARMRDAPHTVTCIDEQLLQARVSRRSLRRRARDAGRVDLDFASPDGWRLIVELKLDSGFQHTQLERYAKKTPVAAVVRDSSLVAAPEGVGRWLGAASWNSLLNDLRALPVDREHRAAWIQLLDVMVADGDFDPQPPTAIPEVAAARDLLGRVAPALVAHLIDGLRRVYREDAEIAATRLGHSAPTGKRGPWAGVGLRTPGDGDWIWIELRNLWSRAPRLRLWYFPWEDPYAKFRLREPHARIQRYGFDHRSGQFVFDRPIPELARASDEVILEIIASKLTELVDSQVFDVEIRRQIRDHRRG